ncbi:hypothetical protein SSX86_026566 [Deinandra increscens subsp. villosa]|uniref:ATP-dependent DNA helicase n=1 Tax=Deinandra increscens subsp. villosa TaxID=3103831 RepID=A0AAP0GMB7_9ASTR
MSDVSGSRRRSRSASSSYSGVQSSAQSSKRAAILRRKGVMSCTYEDIGDCCYVCSFCFALFWHGEKLSSSRANEPPKFNKCCKGGRVRLHNLFDPPPLLKSLLDDTSFLKAIRKYNSLFSMTSFGANVDSAINDGNAAFVFKISGQISHSIGSLCPVPEKGPRFQQLYVYDTENEISNRLRIFNDGDDNDLSPDIVRSLLQMLDANNELVKVFRLARDLCASTDVPEFSLRIFSAQNKHSYDLPSSDCIGAIVVGDDSTFDDYDIVVHNKGGCAKRISKLHPSYMSLQYPLLFPYGQSGWSPDLKLITTDNDNQMTMNMYYSFQLHERQDTYSLLLHGGRLFQQYIVDAYVSIEQNRLDYIRTHQSKFRTELYQGVHDAIFRGDTQGQDIGKRTFLPASFTGGPRYMYQHYQDALAICRVYGNPQYFITFTCNANWPEIQRFMQRYPKLQSQDHAEVIARIFRMKVVSMIDFLKTKKTFGDTEAHLYTIEFQKRGLPHCHMLLWVKDAFKIRSSAHVDKYISAEIPDPSLDPELYQIVTDCMIHGPCGPLNMKSSCMSKSGSCSKKFPKDYQEQTMIDDNGYAHYRRRRNGFTAIKNHLSVDNGFVVPYNKTLLLRYCAHINVEYCGWSMMIKYLFKYISKGADRIRFTISRTPLSVIDTEHGNVKEVDEIKNYVDGRFICPHEAAWRIFSFPIHKRNPAVQVLAVHLENLQALVFRDDDSLDDIVSNPNSRKTTLTEWLYNNCIDNTGRHLRYVDYLSEYCWDTSGKFWLRRSYNKVCTIGRLRYVHPTCGETFYLRMLLAHQKGCRSFADIRTVHGHTYNTYREACDALGLLGDDKEWLNTFEEASFTATSTELRSLFTHMLLYCNINNPRDIWQKYWEKMSDDITYTHGFINPTDLQSYVLYEIELLIRTLSPSSSLSDYSLPLPSQNLIDMLNNKLLMEEKNYDREALKRQHDAMFPQLNVQQRFVYDYVINRLECKSQVLAFVYGHGGTGKTFLWKTIIAHVRSKGDVVLAVAASGIASLLLPNGRTAHSRFRIPIDLTDHSTCNITKKTNLSKLLIETVLIIWDEAPMSERYCLESLDRTLKDILDKPHIPFGGKSIVLGGDFRQTLPIKQKATKCQILDMSLTQSPLWQQFKMFKLTENMRLQQAGIDITTKTQISDFSTWLLNIGDGVIGTHVDDINYDTKLVVIPAAYLIPYTETALSELISFIYDTNILRNPTAEALSTKIKRMASKGLADIIPEEEPFPVEVRVLKKFTPYLGKQVPKHRYMLLIDQKGDLIEGKCEINDTHIYNAFKEDSCYKIDGHICTAARSSGRLADHEASILIAKRAKFHPIAERPIPRFHYNFATYDMLEDREKSYNKLLTVQITNSVRTTSRGYTVMLTLWESIAFAFNTENVIGKVLAVTYAKVTKHQDTYQLESTNTTTLQVNPPIENLQEITARLKNLQTNQKSNPGMQLALSNTEPVVSIAELKLKTPSEYKNKRFTFQGRIKEFEEYRGWFTSKCTQPDCTSQLYKEKGKLICPQDHQFDHPIYAYCVNTIIMDDSATIAAVIYNDELQEMLGMSCKTLVVEKGFDNSKRLPDVLLQFIGKLMTFTIRLRENTTPAIQSAIEVKTTGAETVTQQLLTPAPKTPAKTNIRPRDQAQETETQASKKIKRTTD